MKSPSNSSNVLITILAIVLIVLVVGVIVILASQFNLLSRATPLPPSARPVLVTRVVPGTDLTARAFPTLPPAWTLTPSPTVSPTAPTPTPSETETVTLTPTVTRTDLASSTAAQQ